MTVESALARGLFAGLSTRPRYVPIMNALLPGFRQLILCDEEPDSRRRLTQTLTGLGFPVLATGHPEIAAGLIREQTCAALVVSTDRLIVSTIAALAEVRCARPELPILVILQDITGDIMPPRLADLVLVKPEERKLKHCLSAFVESALPLPVAC